MKNSDTTIIITCIIAAVILIVCLCGLGTVLFIDSNTAHWEPVPGTTTYGWR